MQTHPPTPAASARACTELDSKAANGHYSGHNKQLSNDMQTGAHRFHGQWGLVGWIGYSYRGIGALLPARRFPMVVNDFGDLVEVPA